ncbi:hypothetical protein EI74_0082 [Mycoplasma testudineum]|uniref:Uncharacterized protein n=1 Tax=Mycoplasma testudineum TaxID=244584 RepID=A0A4R6IFF1_9MOLU|nr:hypothetical protein [Mycoplasma testudineum]OYD27179.1 hypothetical protein CG473_00875 [Mycoplasma testudineum]TDO21063.1 hypothetical protein EI74_0082 [Mycoplasma testudineum]
MQNQIKEKNDTIKISFKNKLSKFKNKIINFKKSTSNVVLVKKMVFSALMLTLVLLFSFLATLSGVFNFLNIDISIIFILITIVVAGYPFGFLLLILKLAIGPSFNGSYHAIGMIGHLLVFIAFLTFITLFYLILNVAFLIKSKNNKLKKTKFVVNDMLKELKYYEIILYLVLATIITTLFMSTLNTFIFNAIYFNLFRMIEDASLSTIVRTYNQNDALRVFFFYIPNYYAASYSLYITFNLIQFGISTVVAFLFILTYKKTGQRFDLDKGIYL